MHCTVCDLKFDRGLKVEPQKIRFFFKFGQFPFHCKKTDELIPSYRNKFNEPLEIQFPRLTMLKNISMFSNIFINFFLLLLTTGRFRYLTLTDPGKVWMPDTFFRNEKHGHFHSILVNNVYVRVFPNGDVLYSIR